jgi:predicted MFS family arabinose efflux permease
LAVTRPRPDDGHRGRGDVLATLQAVGLAIFAVLPAFLTGALAVGIRAELAFGPAALGLAVAWFFVTSALSAAGLGQLVERLGLRTSLTVGAASSAVALGGIALAPRYLWLLLAMTVGGAANALAQPAVNALLSQRIPAHRLGLALGIKQSAIPAATLLGGLAVPTLVTVVGWRGTFGVAAGLAAISAVGAWLRGSPPAGGPTRVRRRLRDMPEVLSLTILSVGGLLGAAAATSLGAFLVDAGVESGLREASAGLLIALASVFGLSSRIGLGWYADRRPNRSRYGTIMALLGAGVPGYLLLTADVPSLYVLGALLAYAAGWGWPGLFHYAVVSQNTGTPAAATGVVQSGMSLGAGLGPLAFGVVAERVSYDAAWILAACLSAGAALTFFAGRRHLRRTRHTASTAHLDEVTRLRWDEGGGRRVAEGVESQHHATEHLHVTLYRAAPGRGCAPPPPARTGVVYVLAGGEAELRVAGVTSIVGSGHHLPLPALRSWGLHNRGDEPLVLAQVEHLGNREPPG